MHASAATVLPWSSTEVMASTSSSSPVSGLAPLKRLSGENALAHSFSHFFSPCPLRQFSHPRAVRVGFRASVPVLGAKLGHEDEGEDKGWFRPGGRAGEGFRGGDKNGGRGRGAPPRG